MKGSGGAGPANASGIDRHVGDRIRRRRTMLGFTQEELAASLGVSYQQIQKYEAGANRVSAGRLYQIARRLETPIGSFFDGLDEPKSLEAEPAHGGRATIELVRHFNSIEDEDVRHAVTSLMKSLSSGSPDRRAAQADKSPREAAPSDPLPGARDLKTRTGAAR
jgi:transcriptional regulator with XRE-family HTH domain